MEGTVADRYSFLTRQVSGSLHRSGSAGTGRYACPCCSCVKPSLRYGKGKRKGRKIGRLRFKIETKKLIIEETS